MRFLNGTTVRYRYTRNCCDTSEIFQEGYILNKVITFFFQMVRRASILNKVITCFKWYAGLQYFADLITYATQVAFFGEINKQIPWYQTLVPIVGLFATTLKHSIYPRHECLGSDRVT